MQDLEWRRGRQQVVQILLDAVSKIGEGCAPSFEVAVPPSRDILHKHLAQLISADG